MSACETQAFSKVVALSVMSTTYTTFCVPNFLEYTDFPIYETISYMLDV